MRQPNEQFADERSQVRPTAQVFREHVDEQHEQRGVVAQLLTVGANRGEPVAIHSPREPPEARARRRSPTPHETATPAGQPDPERGHVAHGAASANPMISWRVRLRADRAE